MYPSNFSCDTIHDITCTVMMTYVLDQSSFLVVACSDAYLHRWKLAMEEHDWVGGQEEGNPLLPRIPWSTHFQNACNIKSCANLWPLNTFVSNWQKYSSSLNHTSQLLDQEWRKEQPGCRKLLWSHSCVLPASRESALGAQWWIWTQNLAVHNQRASFHGQWWGLLLLHKLIRAQIPVGMHLKNDHDCSLLGHDCIWLDHDYAHDCISAGHDCICDMIMTVPKTHLRPQSLQWTQPDSNHFPPSPKELPPLQKHQVKAAKMISDWAHVWEHSKKLHWTINPANSTLRGNPLCIFFGKRIPSIVMLPTVEVSAETEVSVLLIFFCEAIWSCLNFWIFPKNDCSLCRNLDKHSQIDDFFLTPNLWTPQVASNNSCSLVIVLLSTCFSTPFFWFLFPSNQENEGSLSSCHDLKKRITWPGSWPDPKNEASGLWLEHRIGNVLNLKGWPHRDAFIFLTCVNSVF